MGAINKRSVGILGNGEIGGAMARICREAGFSVFVREVDYDELKGKKIDYLHINIPEKDSRKFIKIVSDCINELKPKLTIINSSVTPGTTTKIFKLTKRPIVHSPVIGLHPKLYDSIKYHFPKIVGAVDIKSRRMAVGHLTDLGLKTETYKRAEESEAAKLFDLVYYAWNIIFCKWVNEACEDLKLNFDDVYTRQNKIYNSGYSKLLPNVVRPILIPAKGPIGGHCTIPDTMLVHKIYPNRFTKFILSEDKKYKKEVKNTHQSRQEFLEARGKLIDKKNSHDKKD